MARPWPKAGVCLEQGLGLGLADIHIRPESARAGVCPPFLPGLYVRINVTQH